MKELINTIKDQYIDENNENEEISIAGDIFLDVLLMEIRGLTISYSSFKKKHRDLREAKLIEEIENLEASGLHNNDLTELKKHELESLRQEKLQGLIIRSKSNWVEKGEKPTKYFLNLESRNFLNKTIKRVETDGKLITEQKEVLNEIKKFYEKLYKNKEQDIHDVDLNKKLGHLPIPKLNRERSIFLDNPFTETEILSVLKCMKNNKSPGSDGFSVEFFKFFWQDLKKYILNAINSIFEKKCLPISQRLGIITCLPKGDKPRQHLKNWRPITLLNVLYKLISGCISARIKTTLNDMISTSQTGFMSGRYIGENTRLIYDLMSYSEIMKFLVYWF